MAILGLRAMFFLLAGAATRCYLPYGLGIILLFIGAKMLLLDVFHMPIWISMVLLSLCSVLRLISLYVITNVKRNNHKAFKKGLYGRPFCYVIINHIPIFNENELTQIMTHIYTRFKHLK